MTLRDNCTPEQLQAHMVLDAARSGVNVPMELVNWALAALGEPVGA